MVANAAVPLRAFRVWHCQVCNHYYDVNKGIPSMDIQPGTQWEEVPASFVCPGCGFEKDMYTIKDINPASSRPL